VPYKNVWILLVAAWKTTSPQGAGRDAAGPYLWYFSPLRMVKAL